MDTSIESESARMPMRRRIRTLEEKRRILSEAAQPGASVALVARKHELNANVLFAWRRMQQRGLLESQRHAPPLLPVRLTEPTITPTERVSTPRRRRTKTTLPVGASAGIEIAIGSDVRIRLHGEAQRVLLEQVLEWFARR
jgi:transposase